MSIERSERSRLVEGWMAAAGDAAVAGALERVYAAVAEAVAARGPACWASGRCCRFDQAGHRLYVTGLEAAFCVLGLMGEGARAWREGAGTSGVAAVTIEGRAVWPGPRPSGRGLAADLAAARARGGCPFQVANLCGVHGVKPLGCRVYFCDRSAEVWQQELSERMLAEIRAIHDRHGVEYRYGEWREVLGMFVAEGGQ